MSIIYYLSQKITRTSKTSQQESLALYTLEAHATSKDHRKHPGRGPQLNSPSPGRHGAHRKFQRCLREPQGFRVVSHPTQVNRHTLLPKFLLVPLGQLTPAGDLARTRALGTGASPQPAAWPSASLHPLFSLGELSQFVSYFSLHVILCEKKKMSKVSNCKQIKSPYLFILIVSIVLGLVLPGILNRLPLLSAGHPRLLPLTSPGLKHTAERPLSPRTHQHPAEKSRTAGGGEAGICKAMPGASITPPAARPRCAGRRQVPASAAPRRRR